MPRKPKGYGEKAKRILQTETRTLMLVGGNSYGITLDKSMLKKYGLEPHDKIGVIYATNMIYLIPFHENIEGQKRVADLQKRQNLLLLKEKITGKSFPEEWKKLNEDKDREFGSTQEVDGDKIA